MDLSALKALDLAPLLALGPDASEAQIKAAVAALVGQELELLVQTSGPEGPRLQLPSGALLVPQGDLPYPEGTVLQARILPPAGDNPSPRVQILQTQPPPPPPLLAPLLQGEAATLLARFQDPPPELRPLLELFQRLEALAPPEPPPRTAATPPPAPPPLPEALARALERLPEPLRLPLARALQIPEATPEAPSKAAPAPGPAAAARPAPTVPLPPTGSPVPPLLEPLLHWIRTKAPDLASDLAPAAPLPTRPANRPALEALPLPLREALRPFLPLLFPISEAPTAPAPTPQALPTPEVPRTPMAPDPRPTLIQALNTWPPADLQALAKALDLPPTPAALAKGLEAWIPEAPQHPPVLPPSLPPPLQAPVRALLAAAAPPPSAAPEPAATAPSPAQPIQRSHQSPGPPGQPLGRLDQPLGRPGLAEAPPPPPLPHPPRTAPRPAECPPTLAAHLAAWPEPLQHALTQALLPARAHPAAGPQDLAEALWRWALDLPAEAPLPNTGTPAPPPRPTSETPLPEAFRHLVEHPAIPADLRPALRDWLRSLLPGPKSAPAPPAQASPPGTPPPTEPTRPLAPSRSLPPDLPLEPAQLQRLEARLGEGPRAPGHPEPWEGWMEASLRTLSDPQASPREAPFHALQGLDRTAYFEVPVPWMPQRPLQIWSEADRDPDHPEGPPLQRVLLGLHFSALGETRVGLERRSGALAVRIWAEDPRPLRHQEADLQRQLEGLGVAVSLRISPLPEGSPSPRALTVGRALSGLA